MRGIFELHLQPKITERLWRISSRHHPGPRVFVAVSVQREMMIVEGHRPT